MSLTYYTTQYNGHDYIYAAVYDELAGHVYTIDDPEGMMIFGKRVYALYTRNNFVWTPTTRTGAPEEKCKLLNQAYMDHLDNARLFIGRVNIGR